MNNEINFISATGVTTITSMSESVSTEFIDPYIAIAENWHVNSILGDPLIAEIKSQMMSGQTLSAANEILLHKYIQPTAAFATWYVAAPFLYMQTRNIGLVMQFGDNSSSPDRAMFEFHHDKIKDILHFHQDQLNKYLNTNRSMYPLFRPNQRNESDNNNFGIYLGPSN